MKTFTPEQIARWEAQAAEDQKANEGGREKKVNPNSLREMMGRAHQDERYNHLTKRYEKI
jgi:hypothetical protein